LKDKLLFLHTISKRDPSQQPYRISDKNKNQKFSTSNVDFVNDFSFFFNLNFMGNACLFPYASTYNVLEDGNHKSRIIDMQLQDDKLLEEFRYKLLILGAGESGKTTILKQLRFLSKSKISFQERVEFLTTLRWNVIESMNNLLEQAKVEIPFTEEETKSAQLVEHRHSHTDSSEDETFGEHISKLWNSTAIQQVYKQRDKFWNLEAVDYYFAHATRLFQSKCIPTDEDIIMARKRTTGVSVISLAKPPILWEIIDVGGQRTERRKWLSQFENVKCVIYVANLVDYAQVLFEDITVNRLTESLNLFEVTFSHPSFAHTPVFLFLNKKDLFEKMLAEYPLQKYFPEYNGQNNFTECSNFIMNLFQSRLPKFHSKCEVVILAARVKSEVKGSFLDLQNKILSFNNKGFQKKAKEKPSHSTNNTNIKTEHYRRISQTSIFTS